MIAGKNEIYNTHILLNIRRMQDMLKYIEDIYWAPNGGYGEDDKNDSWKNRNEKIIKLLRTIHKLSDENVMESQSLSVNDGKLKANGK